MVERRPDPKDRRIWRLHLQPAAHTELEEISHQRAEINRLLTANLPPATVETTTEALIAMKAVLTARRGDPSAEEAA